MTQRTPVLGLIIEAGITPAARANLLRLDQLAGALNLLNTQSVQLRATQDLLLQPGDASLGGTPGQGAFQVGTADNPALTSRVYSTGQFQVDAPSVGLRLPGTPARWLGLAYSAVAGATADRTLSIDPADASRTLRLAADLKVEPTAGATSLTLRPTAASATTLDVPATGVAVLESHAQTLTAKTIDGLANSLTNIGEASLLAGIPVSKLEDGRVSQAEFFALDGVTSAIQTQLDGKAPVGNYLTGLTGDVTATGPGAASATIAAGAVTNSKLADGILRSKIEAGTPGHVIYNDDTTGRLTSAAKLPGSKVAPDFGAQAVVTQTGFRIDQAANSYTFEAPAISSSLTWRFPANAGANNYVLTTDGAGNLRWQAAAGTGTVTSIDLAVPAAAFTVSGGPITTDGTITLGLASQSANLVWAGPSSGSAATPTFRSLVVSDIPGSLPVSKLAALTASRALVSDSSGFLAVAATTATELGYLSGVTSAVQTQLDGKQATGNYITALTGDVTAAGPGSAVATIAAGAVTDAKIASVSGSKVTGNISGNAANVTGTVALANGGTGATDASGARSNLGLGGAAVLNVGTTAGTVAAGDDARFTAVQKAKTTWAAADGATKTFTHNLGTRDVLVQLYDLSTFESLFVDTVVRTDTNTVTLTASEAPGVSGWRILVVAI